MNDKTHRRTRHDHSLSALVSASTSCRFWRNRLRELEARWAETDWSELEAQVILDRIKNILDQLPQAIHQAHERIIGERRVSNKDKILSFYEPDIHVLVRGKAGAEVEFGNALYLAEQSDDGLILDWDFIEDQPPRRQQADTGQHRTDVRIEWCILAHNLWKLARMAAQRREEIKAEQTQAA